MSPPSAEPASSPSRRIMVCGAGGAGKTTFARELAQRLGVPLIEIDALRWAPGWRLAPREVLRERVERALRSEAWVAEGPCRDLRDVLGARAERILWLDYPLPVVVGRSLLRAVERVVCHRSILNGNRPPLGTEALLLLGRMLRRRWARVFAGETLAEAFLNRPPRHLLCADRRVVRFTRPEQAQAWLSGIAPLAGAGPAGANLSV
ncbi:MAG: AAA family ATPase [Armatimonadetes bacterium]|nr:AAA family ATPase [Armatimonadota bacterium]